MNHRARSKVGVAPSKVDDVPNTALHQRRNGDCKIAQNWETHCKASHNAWEQSKVTASKTSKYRRELYALKRPQSLIEQVHTSVYMQDVNEGKMDLAELRQDGSRNFYSGFTPPGYELPAFLKWAGMGSVYAVITFMVLAVKEVIVRWETIVMCALGFMSTAVFSQQFLDWRPTFETKFLWTGIMFPIVVLIFSVWKRRETALKNIANLRANLIQLVLKVTTGSGHAEKMSLPEARKLVEQSAALFQEIASFLPQDSNFSGPRLAGIYDTFAELQNRHECQMLGRFLLCAFENLRADRDYRTPWGLNYYCFVLGFFSPALLGPHFAKLGCPPGSKEEEMGTCGLGSGASYVSCAFLAVFLAALLSVVKDMEDPFDFNGFDDIVMQFIIEKNALLQMINDRTEQSPLHDGKEAGRGTMQQAVSVNSESIIQVNAGIPSAVGQSAVVKPYQVDKGSGVFVPNSGISHEFQNGAAKSNGMGMEKLAAHEAAKANGIDVRALDIQNLRNVLTLGAVEWSITETPAELWQKVDHLGLNLPPGPPPGAGLGLNDYLECGSLLNGKSEGLESPLGNFQTGGLSNGKSEEAESPFGNEAFQTAPLAESLVKSMTTGGSTAAPVSEACPSDELADTADTPPSNGEHRSPTKSPTRGDQEHQISNLHAMRTLLTRTGIQWSIAETLTDLHQKLKQALGEEAAAKAFCNMLRDHRESKSVNLELDAPGKFEADPHVFASQSDSPSAYQNVHGFAGHQESSCGEPSFDSIAGHLDHLNTEWWSKNMTLSLAPLPPPENPPSLGQAMVPAAPLPPPDYPQSLGHATAPLPTTTLLPPAEYNGLHHSVTHMPPVIQTVGLREPIELN